MVCLQRCTHDVNFILRRMLHPGYTESMVISENILDIRVSLSVIVPGILLLFQG